MKKAIFSFFLSAIAGSLFAQDFANHNLQAMVDAERAFIKMAKDKNRKDAFLFYLSDDVITSGPQGIKKGKSHIEKQEIKNDWLHWEVAYCDIASSGDFGYNTGPWEYRSSRSDEKPVAYGEFNSIWKKQPDGNWKNVLDIGTSHGATENPVRIGTSSIALKAPGKMKTQTPVSVLSIEEDFLNQLKINQRDTYHQFLSKEARLVHAQRLPITSFVEKEEYINKGIPATDWKPVDGEMASSNDMGYVYGTAIVNTNVNGVEKKLNATFVHVWKKENEKWRIVLDVLSY